jgi:hypothetical protein
MVEVNWSVMEDDSTVGASLSWVACFLLLLLGAFELMAPDEPLAIQFPITQIQLE